MLVIACLNCCSQRNETAVGSERLWGPHLKRPLQRSENHSTLSTLTLSLNLDAHINILHFTFYYSVNIRYCLQRWVRFKVDPVPDFKPGLSHAGRRNRWNQCLELKRRRPRPHKNTSIWIEKDERKRTWWRISCSFYLGGPSKHSG